MECPDDLYDALVTTWDAHPQYADVCNIVLDEGEDEEGGQLEEEEDHQDATLMHTFYR